MRGPTPTAPADEVQSVGRLLSRVLLLRSAAAPESISHCSAHPQGRPVGLCLVCSCCGRRMDRPRSQNDGDSGICIGLPIDFLYALHSFSCVDECRRTPAVDLNGFYTVRIQVIRRTSVHRAPRTWQQRTTIRYPWCASTILATAVPDSVKAEHLAPPPSLTLSLNAATQSPQMASPCHLRTLDACRSAWRFRCGSLTARVEQQVLRACRRRGPSVPVLCSKSSQLEVSSIAAG